MLKIGSFRFGSLKINDKTFENDVIVFWDGEVIPRESSHIFSKSELIDVLLKDPEIIVIGTGTANGMKIEKEAEKLAKMKNIELIIKKSPEAIEDFNNLSKNKKVVAVIHVTC